MTNSKRLKSGLMTLRNVDPTAKRRAPAAPPAPDQLHGGVQPPPPSLRRQYRQFIQAMLTKHRRCQSCGNTARETGTKRLFVHHLMTVKQLGLFDPSTIDAGNAIVLCSHCHSMFHPGLRDYTQARWQFAGSQRGTQL